MERRFNDCGKQGAVGREESSVVLGTGGKSERGQRSERTPVLGYNGVLVELLASVVLAASEGVMVRTETTYFSSLPGQQSLV